MDTKKLRQKILDLAIRGKLVPQDPNDEPASVLLERIRKEKERLIKEGKIKRNKKEKTSDTSHYQNLPFELPQGWIWESVGNLCSTLQYGTSEKSSSEGKIAVLRMGNITHLGELNYDDLVFTSNDDDIAKYTLISRDLLFNRTNSSEWVGKTAIYRGEIPAIYAGYIIRFRPILLNLEYVNHVMNSGYEKEYCQSVKTDGVNQSNINSQKLAKFLIPIPPLQEQLRIVSKLEKSLYP
jgi:Restriction endonuclease S subunits